MCHSLFSQATFDHKMDSKTLAAGISAFAATLCVFAAASHSTNAQQLWAPGATMTARGPVVATAPFSHRSMATEYMRNPSALGAVHQQVSFVSAPVPIVSVVWRLSRGVVTRQAVVKQLFLLAWSFCGSTGIPTAADCFRFFFAGYCVKQGCTYVSSA